MYSIKGTWYINVAGRRISSGTRDKAKAQLKEHIENTAAWDRQNGLVIPTWGEACLSWMEHNPVAAANYVNEKMLDWWRPHLAGKKLLDITPKVVHDIIAKHRTISLTEVIRQNTTANHYVEFVGRIIRHGSNLRPKFARYPQPSGNERYLTPDEWGLLAPHLPSELRQVCTFAVCTGLRQANVIGLEWSWVKGDTLIIPAGKTKTKKPYGIPLNKTAQSILKERADQAVKHVRFAFTQSAEPWYTVALLRGLKRACEAAEIERITFHALRHTFASWLAQKGVDRAIRARLGCWTSKGGVADRYAHFDVESLRPFAEMIDAIIKSALCGASTVEVVEKTA